MQTEDPLRHGHYGFDAPYVPWALFAGGIISLLMAVLWGLGPVPVIYGPLWLGLYGLALLAMTASFVYTTRRGKFTVWRTLIASLALKGSEHVLDLGCGRGLVLLEAARHLDSGEAVGIDLWCSLDQSGNAMQTTLDNARLEGVADKVALRTGDLRQLPFENESFDLVLSSLAIHNLRNADDRLRVLDEAARVLAPGGRLLIADFRYIGDYAAHLEALGLVHVQRRNLGWRYWYGGPLWSTSLVSAEKPAELTG